MITNELQKMIEILEEDDIKRLRNKIVDIIVEVVKKQLNDSSYYIISPDDINEVILDNLSLRIEDIVEVNNLDTYIKDRMIKAINQTIPLKEEK